MASFNVPIVCIEDDPKVHPNADLLEIVKIMGYNCVVGKGVFKKGDYVAYIPEGSVVPLRIQEELGLVGKLAGSKKNRVKAVKLRGFPSQGVLLPAWNLMQKHNLKEGDDVAELLDIIKYEPPIPVSMGGTVQNLHGDTLRFDVENYKRYPDVLKNGEEVYVTEKLHGTWCCLGFHNEIGPIVTSKGLSAKGLAFKIDDVQNKNNVYVRAWQKYGKKIENAQKEFAVDAIYVLGEIVGTKIQDLTYGHSGIEFYAFDLWMGDTSTGSFENPEETWMFSKGLDFNHVPIVYTGPFDENLLASWTNGVSLIEDAKHMREGIVIRSADGRRVDELGRVILKSISNDYLFRKGGTEYE